VGASSKSFTNLHLDVYVAIVSGAQVVGATASSVGDFSVAGGMNAFSS
jgi:hypothetical protein